MRSCSTSVLFQSLARRRPVARSAPISSWDTFLRLSTGLREDWRSAIGMLELFRIVPVLRTRSGCREAVLAPPICLGIWTESTRFGSIAAGRAIALELAVCTRFAL